MNEIGGGETFLTVAICTLDRPSTIGLAADLQSEAGSLSGVEILIVNNGPSESIKGMIKALSKARYAHEPQPGLSRARNAAVSAARSEYILFVDDDIIPSQDYLASVVGELKAHCPDILGGPVHPVLRSPMPAWLAPARIERLKAESGWTPDGTVSGGNFAVRRRVFDAIGGFRADLGMVGGTLGFLEEFEFTLRYRASPGRTGAGIYYSRDCAVGHESPEEKMRFAYLCARAWKSHLEKGRLFSALAANGRRRLAFRLSCAAIASVAPVADLAAAVWKGRRTGRRRALSEWAFASIGRLGQAVGAIGGRAAAAPPSGRTLKIGAGSAEPQGRLPARITVPDYSPASLSAASGQADFWAYDRLDFDRTPPLRSLARLALDFPRSEISAPAPGIKGMILSALGFLTPSPHRRPDAALRRARR